MSDTPPPYPKASPERILRDGYTMAVTFGAPAEVRENLLAATVEAETTRRLKEGTPAHV